ncbi:MAG: DEAD/DEAH box helicase [Draconibacterium sp.]|nr:DEAD/DEAH box helicase [Draconibacterium sp.]
MSKAMKTQKDILDKFNIETLNPMQKEAHDAILSNSEIVLLSPTGSGKTLAFLLPVIKELDPAIDEIQVLILVPSRELAIQIEQVAREMGTGFKINAVYGGRTGQLDKLDLKHRPAILIGTPGRVADHLRRDRFPVEKIKTLVLDEFDKSLEIGFEAEMGEIVGMLPNIQKRILTSATFQVKIPDFARLENPVYVDYLDEGIPQLDYKIILSPERDKLESLAEMLGFIGFQPGIIFCNFKDSIQRVSEFLTAGGIPHGCFYGGMEQIDRERALVKFRNGTHKLLIATDLAARGIDIPEIRFIIHYHLPLRSKEFIHRNGRTARMNAEGTAYILIWEEEELPDFVRELKPESLRLNQLHHTSEKENVHWKTLYISGGRRDKISKGDIAGLFLKQGNLNVGQLGIIEVKQDCAFVAVHSSEVEKVIELTNNCKLKTKKIRVSEI